MDWNIRKSWIWRIRGWKFLISRSIYYSSKCWCPYFFVFSIFETRDYTIRSGKNRPIASEIIDVKSSLMYNMLYIILKHFLRWFQKYKIDWNLLNFYEFLWRFMFWAVKMKIFDKNMKIRSCDVLFHSKSFAYDYAIGFVQKFYSWWHLAVKINFFQNFYKWRHNDRKWSKSSNSCTN